MKEKLKKLPPPLRKQALLRFTGAGACFCLLLLVALFRRRPKAVVMECGDRRVKVFLRARVRNLTVGERLRLYVAESSPVYEDDDVLVLSGYLAIEVGKK